MTVSVCLGLKSFLGIFRVKRWKVLDKLELVGPLSDNSNCNSENEMLGKRNTPVLWLSDLVYSKKIISLDTLRLAI